METDGRYTLYGDLARRDAAGLAAILVAKRVPVELVDETSSLAMVLASRAGRDRGPYLRTPEGFVLADPFAIREWLDRVHPEPVLLPTTPVRRTCARLLEDWVELWLPHWPRRSWGTLERLGLHVGAAGFLLGRAPTRPDRLLAAWLETEVLVHAHAREHLARIAPRLVRFGDDLLAAEERVDGSAEEGDAIPISLLDVLEEIAADYHAFLVLNHQALKDHEDEVRIDLGLGREPLPVQPECEARRTAIGRELSSLDREVRRRVAGMLEPVGAWHALTLPPVLEDRDTSDPRSL
ncbi:MAG: hypothetical protein NXI30_07150 [bacterium]|nr:hypothetical protein [bacterium]